MSNLLNQIGLILNIIGGIIIALSITERKANCYLCDENNKPIKPLVIKNRFLYLGLFLLFLGFLLSFVVTFLH